MLEFHILLATDVRHGVAHADGRDQQRRAAADANEHHEHALFIPSHVAQRDLLQKRKPAPER